MGDFLGIILGIIFTIFLFMALSKLLGMPIGYRNKGSFVEPDDLDKTLVKGRKLVDKNYRIKKDNEEKYAELIGPVQFELDRQIRNKVAEEKLLKSKGYPNEEIQRHLFEKYNMEIFRKLFKQKSELKEKFGITEEKK